LDTIASVQMTNIEDRDVPDATETDTVILGQVWTATCADGVQIAVTDDSGEEASAEIINGLYAILAPLMLGPGYYDLSGLVCTPGEPVEMDDDQAMLLAQLSGTTPIDHRVTCEDEGEMDPRSGARETVLRITGTSLGVTSGVEVVWTIDARVVVGGASGLVRAFDAALTTTLPAAEGLPSDSITRSFSFSFTLSEALGK
jgi:hypothetical protein